MKTKLIALDLDGTLLNSSGSISDKTLITIRKAIEKGIEIVLATGRSVELICEEIKSIQEIKYVISSNGSAIVNLRENKMVFSDFIALDVLEKITKIIEKYPIAIEFYSNGHAYIDEDVLKNPKKYGLTEDDVLLISNNHKIVKNIFSMIYSKKEGEWTEVVEKINIPFLKDNMKNQVLNSLLCIKDQIKITSSVKDNLEINNYSANKGNGLKKLAKLLEINLDETAAIGDGNNDMEMIEMSGIGIAMENASEAIKTKADFVTLDNNKNGAAEAILQILNESL